MRYTVKTERGLRHAAAWMALLLVLLFVGYGAGHGQAADKDGAARILVLTDFHGRLEERGSDVGLPKFLSAVQQWREASADTVLVAVGDMFTGSVESDLLRGRPVFTGMMEAGLVLSAVGNHEFDWSATEVARWEREGLPFVCANVRGSDGQPPAGVRPYILRQVGDVKVAFVGLITQETALSTVREHVAGLTFTPPVEALAVVAREARMQGAEAVVVLAHLAEHEQPAWDMGIDPQLRALARVPGVLAVVAGHSHEEHLGAELAEPAAGKLVPVPIVQPAPYGRGLAVLILARDEHGRVRVTAELDKLWQRKASLAEAPAGKEIARAARAALGPALEKVVARTAFPLPHDEQAPSLLGEVVCEALRGQTGAEVGLTNGGGIRSSLEQGEIRERDIFRVLPFDNNVVLMSLSGADLRAVLEYALNNTKLRCVQLSGVRAVYDDAAPAGNRVVSLTRADGRELGNKDRVQVAVNAFIAQGGDGFPLPRMGQNVHTLEVSERDAVRRYLAQAGVLRPEFQGWLTVRRADGKNAK